MAKQPLHGHVPPSHKSPAADPVVGHPMGMGRGVPPVDPPAGADLDKSRPGPTPPVVAPVAPPAAESLAVPNPPTAASAKAVHDAAMPQPDANPEIAEVEERIARDQARLAVLRQPIKEWPKMVDGRIFESQKDFDAGRSR